MNSFASEFQQVFGLYLKLGEELTKILDVDSSNDSLASVKSILKNRDCLNRVEQMNSRILKLSGDWEQCRSHLDDQSRDEVLEFARAAKAQALQLQKLVGIHIQKLQSARDELGKRLEELKKGSRYLKTLKPPKYNYPKFIDSTF